MLNELRGDTLVKVARGGPANRRFKIRVVHELGRLNETWPQTVPPCLINTSARSCYEGLSLSESRHVFTDAGSTLSGHMFKRIDMPDADVILFEGFFDASTSDVFFKELNENAAWRREKIKLYGKRISIPRLTAWYGDQGKSYKYSGITVSPEPWTPALLDIKRAIEAISGIQFNSVLLNMYRTGRDSVAWHSDDEPELGREPVIGSVSLGQTRVFQFKHKISGLREEIILRHGSYLLMRGTTQHHWLHQIPKQTTACDSRINLTFRVVQ
jgi:alkylated DNA repair dioxygenase AlkB